MNTEHINNVKETVHSLFLNNPYESVEVGIGCKQSGGQYTEEKCIRFGVKEKLPLDQISVEKRIPSTMNIDGVTYKTDVYQSSGEAKILALLKPISEVNSDNQATSSILYRNGIPIIGPTIDTQQYWDDNTTYCYFWLYDNYNTGTVTVSFTYCRDYPYTGSITPDMAQWYAWVPAGYTPPNFPNMTRAAAGEPAGLVAYDCCSEPGIYGPVSSRVTPHRSKHRPLVGGISMMAPPPSGYLSAGTLGGIVIDSLDGKMVGITNNHVCSNPGENVNRCKFIATDSTYYATDSEFRTINNYQPASLDSGAVNQLADKVGTTKRAFPLTSTGTNYIDCGLVNLSDSVLGTGSWNELSASFASAPPFASTAEIDALTTSNEIFKSSRTTGPIRLDLINEYTSAKPCNIRVTQTSTSVNVSGYPPTILFADLLRFESPHPDNTVPGLGGDSGSFVYAKIGGVWKVIGLLFAGDGASAGWACRIDRVANLMKVQAYQGSAIDANPNTPTYTTLDYATYGSEVSASIGGKTYWQVGRQ